MQVRNLLNQKGREVQTTRPEESVQTALDRMIEHRVGSLLVREGEQVTGIVTERDVLRRGLGDARKLRDQTVAEIMTREVVIATPDDSLQYLMGLMVHNRIRHVPVFADGKLEGVVSIGDIIFALLEESEATNRYLHEYISGTY
ncbi:MAG: CBS domain-containing protein [Candidatus Delongbacteria bacterium]